MLPTTLNTNEVKDRSGTEQEFQLLEAEGRKRVYALIGESPALKHRITISHSETGSGIRRTRSSVVRVDKESTSDVDNVTTVVSSAYCVSRFPVGARLTADEFKDVLANLLSFMATTGSGTTVLFDGSGNGAASQIAGSL